MKTSMHFKILTVSLIVMTANCLNAGFLDGLKKIGGGVVEAADSAFDATVNITTSAVQSVSQGSTLSGSPTNTPITVQTDKVEVPTMQTTEPTQVTTPTSSTASISATPAPAPAAQVVESRPTTEADNDDNLLSRRKHRKEKKNQQRAEAKHDARVGGHVASKNGKPRNEGVAAYQKFISNEFKPKIEAFEQALARRDRAFRSTYWRNGVFSMSEIGRYESGQSELALNRLREIAKGDDAMFRKLRSSSSAWSFAGDSLRQPWNYWTINRMSPYFNSSNGKFGTYLHDNPEPSMRYLDETNAKIESLDNLSKWIEKARAWLAREDDIIRKECFIGESSAKRIADLHGKADYKPFAVYKDIAFGDSVIDVFEKMKKIDNGAEWMRMSRNDDQAGKTIEAYLHGKQLYTKILTRHGLDFIFGSFAPDEGAILVRMEMEFATAPDVGMLVDKYGKAEGAKVRKVRDIIDRKWPETEIGQFGLLLFTALENKAKSIEEKNGDSSTLRKDMLAVSEKYCQGTAVEKTIVAIDGVEISICENSESHKVSKLIFEDTLLSAKLKELCIKQKEADKKAEADAKAEAEKKAKAAAVEF